MANIRLLLAYEGTHYLGWQKTRMGPSIEQSLEVALATIFHTQFSLQAASRTDAGVHAEGQVVNFFIHTDFDLYKLQRSLLALLPSDISVLKLEVVKESFHPTLDAQGKEYHYNVCNDNVQLPFHRKFSWHFPYPLNLYSMRQAATMLTGEWDFSAFSNQKVTEGKRKIHSIEILSLPDRRLRFVIRGDNFLYKMVRNLVGTLLYVGCGKISLAAIPTILKERKRSNAGVTAPAHGLVLHKVFYID